ncbi:MAG: ferric reductase-like transmembrane domain-containing protein [Pirellulaceae bacterium]
MAIVNGAVPVLVLSWDAWYSQLGANAVNHALHITGILSLLFLLLSLLVTPVRRLTGWNQVVAVRRALGLYGFFYALLHFGIYVVWDRALSLGSTIEEIVSRRFLLIGFVAVTVMVPLAVTSTNRMIQWMGAARWKRLHRLSYLVAILGVTHYYLLVKSDLRQPIAFGFILASLLVFRAVDHYWDLRTRAAGASRISQKEPRRSPARPKMWRGELRVASIVAETPSVKTFRFRSPNGEPLPFKHRAGQYLTVTLPIED